MRCDTLGILKSGGSSRIENGLGNSASTVKKQEQELSTVLQGGAVFAPIPFPCTCWRIEF